MSTVMTSPSTPGVWQRVLRGYGPLAALVVLLILVSILVPSKVPESGTLVNTDDTFGSSNSDPTSEDPVPGDGPSASDPNNPSSQPGAPGSNPNALPSRLATGSAGKAGQKQPGKVVACPPDRPHQVPGDPYSPPCIGFTGDNGGATHQGVTDTEIKVSFRRLNERGFQQTLAELAGATIVDRPADIERTVMALAEYFNSRYQFYGRKLLFQFYDGTGSNTTELLGRGRDKAETDALKASELKVFADLSGTSEPYANALTHKGILAFGTPYLSRKWHSERRPFAWSIATDGTKVANFGAEYAIKRMCGKKAEFAGGTGANALKGRDRRFATLVPTNPWYQESVQVARTTFEKAGCDPGINREYELDLGQMSNQAANIVAALKNPSDGKGPVTTIFCGCDPILPVFLSGAAAREGYFPEFVVVGTALTDHDIVGQLWNQDFATHAFGISSLTEPSPATQSLGYAAYKSVRKDEPAFSVELIYYQMAELAIGIHMAGPNLNPTTFEKGMFEYPPRLGPVGLWDFGPDDYTSAEDVREIYWDRNATSNYNGKTGAYRDTNPGKRYKVGELPPGDPNIPPR
ncbi:MAG: ABC transporter substrate-binding protein [Actinomycetota bacterium]|nr:ABC transporter substrate-binding protein [Actinomycetota bacterium]